MRDVLILVGLWCGAVTALAAAGAVVWKLVSPHADRYVAKEVSIVVAPLARDIETLRTEIVSRPGDPTLLETAADAADSAGRVERKVDALHNQVGRVSRRIEQVEGRVMITHSVLGQHVAESDEWHDRAAEALEEQGIELPDRKPPRTTGDRNERK